MHVVAGEASVPPVMKVCPIDPVQTAGAFLQPQIPILGYDPAISVSLTSTSGLNACQRRLTAGSVNVVDVKQSCQCPPISDSLCRQLLDIPGHR
ncbi:hypothetical protein TcWFU_004401 [Taenia crassiceps]|uniref:Uncharacterized protein n=1 Tax=Taenia crassiceps TaxID=6207 RepID=A0ABR4Q773_9CEST